MLQEPEIRGHLKYFLKRAINIPQFGKSSRDSEDYPQRASMLRYLYKLKTEKSCNCSGTWNIRGMKLLYILQIYNYNQIIKK